MRVEGLGAKAIAGLAMLVLAVTALPGVARADSATAQATVRLALGLQVTSIEKLDFGGVEVGDAPGTVTVTPFPATRSADPPTLIDPLGSAGFNAAELTVTGTPATSYTINLPNSFAVKDLRSDPIAGVTELAVILLTSYTTTLNSFSLPGDEWIVGEIGANGTDTIFIGGTLDVLDSAKKGHYRGDVTVTIFQ